MLANFVPSFAQLVDDSRAAIARFILDVGGPNLGEDPPVGEFSRGRRRLAPSVVRAPRDTDGSHGAPTENAVFSESTTSYGLTSGPSRRRLPIYLGHRAPASAA